MPVIVLEARDLTSPLFLVRTWALLSGCLTFSLVASTEVSELQRTPSYHNITVARIFCMFTWCFLFTLTLFIHVLNIIQFHTLIPISWKNLTVTVAAFGSLMYLSSSVLFPWIVMDHQHVSPRAVAAAVASWLTFLAYICEAWVIRTHDQEQRGYMASTPGLLKILPFWGGCQMMPLIAAGFYGLSEMEKGNLPNGIQEWKLWVSGMAYLLCLMMSLGSALVIIGDCGRRCPLPFDRLLAGFSLFGVLLYIVATAISFTKVMTLRNPGHTFTNSSPELVIMEAAIASITLLAYTVDLVFSIKLLCDRNRA